jgi:hypothetical protein
MSATVTDKFTKASSGTRPTPTTLTATLASGASPGTATCAALTGWPTDTAVLLLYLYDRYLGQQGIRFSNRLGGGSFRFHHHQPSLKSRY